MRPTPSCEPSPAPTRRTTRFKGRWLAALALLGAGWAPLHAEPASLPSADFTPAPTPQSAPTSTPDARARLAAAQTLRQQWQEAFHAPTPEIFWPAAADQPLFFRLTNAAGAWRFQQVDLTTGALAPAFDHQVLAQRLSEISHQRVSPDSLPLPFLEAQAASEELHFQFNRRRWAFHPAQGTLSPAPLVAPPGRLVSVDELLHSRRQRGPERQEPTLLAIENATAEEIAVFWINHEGQRVPFGSIAAGSRREQETFSGHRWLFVSADGRDLGGIVATRAPLTALLSGEWPQLNPPRSAASPDGRWRAAIQEDALVVEPTDGSPTRPLTRINPERGSYHGPFYWSPDSRWLVCCFTPEASVRQITIVQSSPPDQLQPKLLTLDYPKAGDPIRQPTPHLFDLQTGRQIPLSTDLFANPWSNSHFAWAPDSSEFTFLYNQRGHQLLRLVGIAPHSGQARTILEETSPTFIDYSQKLTLSRLPESRELIWASERSGWNHLYLVDETTGAVTRPLTRGNWNVRELVSVDATNRTAVIAVVGYHPDQDPYQRHFLRISLDGNPPLALTTADGDHRLEFSPDGRFYLDTWSRPDHPPVVELRRSADGSLIAELARASTQALEACGWRPPERFVAPGRDGKTPIHGLIFRPSDFDPQRSYPVVEEIYAGPHDFFTPKHFQPTNEWQDLAELGFIVVKLDGMGTNWRSRAFHDVAWKNLMDAGLPDRIAWIHAAAKSRPWMDLSRVGVIGGSAGGQNALAALLFHGDFYRVAVADSGCHDNRMDKIWWNEAWMGWPVDESYAANSNVTHAANLQGKLLLMFGELDTNVDPASSAQMAHALQQADKDFDYLPVINAGHCAARTSDYGAYRQAQFLLHHLNPN